MVVLAGPSCLSRHLVSLVSWSRTSYGGAAHLRRLPWRCHPTVSQPSASPKASLPRGPTDPDPVAHPPPRQPFRHVRFFTTTTAFSGSADPTAPPMDPMDPPLPDPAPALSLVESSKRAAAYRAVDEHYPATPKCIGIGSGSTVVYVVDRIAQLPRDRTEGVTFVPTGYQSKELIVRAGLKLGSVELLTEPMDVVFDGADEVDPFLNCIKGGGACLFQEKLVAIQGRKLVIVADFRKLSPSLSTHYVPGIPIEVVPHAATYVLSRLALLGSVTPTLRMGGTAKAGPCVTDNGNFIIDAPFPDGFIPPPNSHKSPGRPLSPASSAVAVDAGLTAETGPERVAGSSILGKEEGHPGASIGMGLGANENVEELARALKSIVGVVEHGIFWAGDRKPIMVYFGMEDGSVSVRQQH